jgi:hypothetical protein
MDDENRAGGKLIAPHAWSMAGWPSETQSEKADAVEVWGYAANFAYYPGDVVKLHVSCTRPTYSLKIVRDGRRPVQVFEREGIQGTRHPVPDESYAKGCAWPAALEVAVGKDWRPGFYLVTFTTTAPHDRFESEAFFVVRTPKEQRNGIAFLLTTSTLIAYNDWGGANHYRGIGDDPRYEVASPVLSTQRPIGRGFLRKPQEAPRESHTFSPPMFWEPRYPAYEWARLYGYSRHHADAFWATYERPFVVWAEEQGYALDYLTQHELHFEPDCLAGYSTLVIVGHDEYWTWEMRDQVDAFVDRGGSLARFGGNFLWQVRLSDDGGTQFCYRSPDRDPEAKSNPQRVTTVWDYKPLNRPAAATMGLTGMGGTYNRYGVAAPRSSGGFTVYRPDHWAFAGTDLYYGDLLGGTPVNLATFELDSVEYTFRRGLPYPTFEDGAPETLEILAMAPAVRGEEDRFDGKVPLNGPMEESLGLMAAIGDQVPPHHHELEGRGAGMIAAFSRGRGEVFNGGSTEWPRALELRDPFVEKIVKNVLDRFSQRSNSEHAS